MKKFIPGMIKHYIISLLFFEIVVALVEIALLSYVHAIEDFITIFVSYQWQGITVFTVIYTIVITYIYQMNKRYVRILNEKLKEMRERIEENEKKKMENDEE